MVGRVKTFEAIVKGLNVPTPGIPESFKVLIKELQSLALDVKVLDKDGEEIDLKQNFDEDDNLGLAPVDMDMDVFDEESVRVDEEISGSFGIENPDDDIFAVDDVDDDSVLDDDTDFADDGE